MTPLANNYEGKLVSHIPYSIQVDIPLPSLSRKLPDISEYARTRTRALILLLRMRFTAVERGGVSLDPRNSWKCQVNSQGRQRGIRGLDSRLGATTLRSARPPTSGECSPASDWAWPRSSSFRPWRSSIGSPPIPAVAATIITRPDRTLSTSRVQVHEQA